MPFMWDNYWWDLQTDLAFVACSGELEAFAEIVKVQYFFFYSAAAFWKFNVAFLD